MMEHQREYLLGRVHTDERGKEKMSKKILVISTSLRAASNSDMLAEAFMDGARQAEYEVEKVSLKDKTIGARKGLEGFIACFERARLAGCVFAGGVDAPGTIKKHGALEKAREMGRQV